MPLLHRRKRSTSVEAPAPSTSTAGFTISQPTKMQPSASGSSSRQALSSVDPLPHLTRATLNHMRTGSIPVIASSGLAVPSNSSMVPTPVPGSSKGKERERERGRERHREKERRAEKAHAASTPVSAKGKERELDLPATRSEEASVTPLYARFAKSASAERPEATEERRRERTESHRTAAELQERDRRREERKRKEARARDAARVIELKPESPLATLERRAHRDAERERERERDEQARDKEKRRRETEKEAMEAEVARAREREERRRRRREKQREEEEANRAREAAWARAREDEASAQAEAERRQREEAERQQEEARSQQEDARRRQEEFQRQQDEARMRQEEVQRQQEDARMRQEEVQRQQEEARRQQIEAQRQYEADMQRQRERTASMQSQTTSTNGQYPSSAKTGRRTSSRAPAPFQPPSSNPSSASGPPASYPYAEPSHPPEYAPLAAHHAHHHSSSTGSSQAPMHTYPPAPGAPPAPSLRSSRSFENARNLGRRQSNVGPPLSPSARHGGRMYGYGHGGGHHRSLSSGTSVTGVSVQSHGLPTPPSSASSAIGQASRPGSVQVPQPQQALQGAAPYQGQQRRETPAPVSADLSKSSSKASVDKPLPTPVDPVASPTRAAGAAAPVPPSPTTEASKPRRKYSLLAAFGLKSKEKDEAKRTPTASHHHAASAAQPMPISTRTPSNKSDPRRSSTQPGPRSPSRTPSYQQVPVIPRTSSGSHPSVHQIFQHPSPPGSQTRVYPPQGYGYGYQQPPSGHPYSPPQSVSSSATPSRATSPRSVHRKAPPPIHAYPTQPQQTPSALSLHSVGSLQANGQPAPSIHASLASASSTAFSPSSAGIVSPLTGSISALNLPQSRSRPDVGTGSASGHGHESREDVRSDESHIPPVHRPPQSEADEDLPLSRMILLQPRQASQLPISPPARSHNQPQAQDQSSPPPTHSLDVPQDVDRDRHTPSPGPVHSHPSEQESHGLEHDQHSEVPVRGKPRIFAAMGAEESEADHGDAQPPREQWEHETPLVQGRPRIFAAQEEGGSDEQGADAYAQQDGAYTQPADAYAPQGSAYTQPVQPAEKEFQGQTADGHVRDYPHTHGYPTPRSRSPVLPSDQAAVLRDDEDTRGRRREVLPKDDQDGHRISRSLPPTPSPRAPTPEVQHDTDVEHEKGGSADDHGLGRRRLRKGGKLKRGSSQSDSENEGRRRGHSFGLGLRGIFGVRALTEKQVEKLGAKDGAGAAAGASAVPVNMGAAPMGVAPGVQRSASGSDGRRKLKKDARRGRRDERGDERPTELVRDRADEASFVHIDSSAVQEEMQRGRTGPGAPPTPITPEEYARARAQRRGAKLGKGLPAVIAQALAPSPERKEPLKPSMPYPLVKHLLEPALLAGLLTYLSYNEWLAVAALNRQVRDGVTKRRELTECALEKFLGPVGYARWTWGLDPSLAKARSKERANDGDKEMPRLPNDGEPVTLALQDLNNYMRGVSMPSHQFSTLASEYLHARGDPNQGALMDELAACCRAYTRIVLRLRAQAEAEARNPSPAVVAASQAASPPPSRRAPSLQRGNSRASSRAPSQSPSYTATIQAPIRAAQSPLFRLRRAPLIQVFVPSPEGDWLSDDSILACEGELKKAGVAHLLRAGDVVWDVAVGDEGNIGRMVWDGAYLVDLDFTWSRIGDLPKYLPTLAFPPSYFHRVIRTQGSGNPICHIDIAPWGEDIASNLQLLQDRVKTETPQGNHHTVVRWVHRSSFTIMPPAPNKPLRIPPMPHVGPGPSHGVWLVDPGWYGRVIVEAEGTNEGLADLQVRCGRAFPPRAVGARAGGEQATEERSFVFRILRERSRPGEIWIRTVRDKERLR